MTGNRMRFGRLVPLLTAMVLLSGTSDMQAEVSRYFARVNHRGEMELVGVTVRRGTTAVTFDARKLIPIDVVHFRSTDPTNLAVVSGTRAHDMALRLKYAGVEAARIAIEPDVARAFDATLARAGAGGTAYLLPTYTVMLELQRLVAARGLVRPYWAAAA